MSLLICPWPSSSWVLTYLSSPWLYLCPLLLALHLLFWHTKRHHSPPKQRRITRPQLPCYVPSPLFHHASLSKSSAYLPCVQIHHCHQYRFKRQASFKRTLASTIMAFLLMGNLSTAVYALPGTPTLLLDLEFPYLCLPFSQGQSLLK